MVFIEWTSSLILGWLDWLTDSSDLNFTIDNGSMQTKTKLKQKISRPSQFSSQRSIQIFFWNAVLSVSESPAGSMDRRKLHFKR